MGMDHRSDALRIRKTSGLARYRVAIRAHTSDEIVRVYELDRTAVSADVRARLDHVYAELLVEVRARVANLPSWPPRMQLVGG
jgi:hypothetical protein